MVTTKEILDSITYTLPGNPATAKALEVANQLSLGIELREGLSYIPDAWVAVGLHTLGVHIGDVCVWDSENDQEDNLTANYCRIRWQEHIAELAIAAGMMVADDKPCPVCPEGGCHGDKPCMGT